jgi:hypothetical protein
MIKLQFWHNCFQNCATSGDPSRTYLNNYWPHLSLYDWGLSGSTTSAIWGWVNERPSSTSLNLPTAHLTDNRASTTYWNILQIRSNDFQLSATKNLISRCASQNSSTFRISGLPAAPINWHQSLQNLMRRTTSREDSNSGTIAFKIVQHQVIRPVLNCNSYWPHLSLYDWGLSGTTTSTITDLVKHPWICPLIS